MLAISHSDSRLLVLEIEKSLLGKLIVKSGGKESLNQDTRWQETISKIAKNKHTAFAISDINTHIFRFEVSKDIKYNALENAIIQKVKEATNISLQHMAYDYFLVKTDENSQHVLFVAAPLDVLSSYHELAKKAETKSLIVVPQSLAIFEIVRHSIEKDETILYIDSNQYGSTLTLFDSHGPVMNVKGLVPHNALIDEIKKALASFTQQYDRHIATIVLGGEKNESVDRDAIAEATGTETIRSDTIFHDAILDLGITFNEENPHTYLTALGLGILSFKKESLNLAKKENLSRLNSEDYPSHTNKTNVFTKKNLFALAAFLIFIPLVLFGYSEFKQLKKLEEKIPSTQKVEPSPTPILQRSDLILQVLNGSGESGLAGKAADNLKKKGYSQIDTKNADSYTYEGVTLKIKDAKKQYKDILLSDLKEDYSVNSDIETLDKDNKYDAVVILGK